MLGVMSARNSNVVVSYPERVAGARHSKLPTVTHSTTRNNFWWQTLKRMSPKSQNSAPEFVGTFDDPKLFFPRAESVRLRDVDERTRARLGFRVATNPMPMGGETEKEFVPRSGPLSLAEAIKELQNDLVGEVTRLVEEMMKRSNFDDKLHDTFIHPYGSGHRNGCVGAIARMSNAERELLWERRNHILNTVQDSYQRNFGRAAEGMKQRWVLRALHTPPAGDALQAFAEETLSLLEGGHSYSQDSSDGTGPGFPREEELQKKIQAFVTLDTTRWYDTVLCLSVSVL